jgi:hypothetical protein
MLVGKILIYPIHFPLFNTKIANICIVGAHIKKIFSLDNPTHRHTIY